MRIHAFQGYRYTPAAGDPQDLAAPPFDQIDPALAERLRGSADQHFAHLTRPVPGEDNDMYRHAAAVHVTWVSEGKVARDGEPALYPYVIESPDGERRLGLCALVGVEPEGSGVIRPHERTLDKPFEDRLNLLSALKVDLEPVMFLSDDGGALEALLAVDLAALEAVAVHRDGDGNRHHLFRLDDPERIALYREALAPCSAAIADGHHRYKVGRTYAEQTGAEAGTAAGAKMAVLFSLTSGNLVIDPIHRGLGKRHDLAPLHAMIASRETLEVSNGDALAAAVAAAPQPVLAFQRRGEAPELWYLDPRRMPAGSPPGAETLAVAHLHFVLLPELGLTTANYLDGTVQYRSDPAVLYDQVQNGALEMGIWLPKMSGEAFGKAISKGDLLPAKATRFLPKLVSGLVWSGHDGRVL